MIDSSYIYYIEYKNLSDQSFIAEKQKDYIVEALKKTEGQNKVFVEEHVQSITEPSIIMNNKFYEIRCVICFFAPEFLDDMKLSSIKTEKENEKYKEISFDLIDKKNKIMNWKIEIKEVFPTIIHSGDAVRVSFKPTQDIEINGFGKSLKNAGRGETVRIQLSNWFAKSTQRWFGDVVDAIVIAPGEVEYGVK